MVNFNGDNASQVIKDNVPWKFHAKHFLVAYLLIGISFLSFFASYFEF